MLQKLFSRKRKPQPNHEGMMINWNRYILKHQLFVIDAGGKENATSSQNRALLN